MGADGLFTELGPVAREVGLFRACIGATVGVDAFGWLHQMAVNNTNTLVLAGDPGPTVDEFMERARHYIVRGVLPIFVLDGRRLPGKTDTDEERARTRLAATAEVDAVLDALDEADRAAVHAGTLAVDIEEKTLRAAVAVDDKLVTAVIAAMRRCGVSYVKAPYEADHQLRALDALNIVQFVESVDSDLVVHGVRKLLTKVRLDTGTAMLYERSMVLNPPAAPRGGLLALLKKWGLGGLRAYAALGNGDYSRKALPGFGPATAIRILQAVAGSASQPLTAKRLATTAKRLAQQPGSRVPVPASNFEEVVGTALDIYENEVVYDVRNKRDRPLSALLADADGDGWGDDGEDDEAVAAACGEPATGEIDVTTTAARGAAGGGAERCRSGM
jgi:5'-3' exonuclease